MAVRKGKSGGIFAGPPRSVRPKIARYVLGVFNNSLFGNPLISAGGAISPGYVRRAFNYREKNRDFQISPFYLIILINEIPVPVSAVYFREECVYTLKLAEF